MAMNVQSSLLSRSVNLYEDILLEITLLNRNPDDVFIVGNIYYNFDNVAQFKILFNKYKIRIWDHYVGFTQALGDEITLKVTILDPTYTLPAK
jgi:hypothetical protein